MALMTIIARSDFFFTAMLLPSKYSRKKAIGTRYISSYITTRRKAPDNRQRRSFAMMSPGGISMATPVVRFRIDFEEYSSVGPGKIRLLEAIRDSGSLSQAARDIGMSYRRAWLLVESLRKSFREAVTVASTGGREGGGMRVTEFGDALIDNYRQLERDFDTLAARRFRAIIGTVNRHSRTQSKISVRAKLD
jgi:molybdate transport system regulatory protein